MTTTTTPKTSTASILRPGILVSLKTTVRGGVHYAQEPLPLDDGTIPEGANVKRWATTRVISDPEDYERAKKVRGAAASAIRRVCAATAFGLLCAQANEDELDAAVAAARALCDAHNRVATTTNVAVYVLKGRIAESDEEAASAIASEVSQLLEDMKRGIRAADPAAIRDAANRAREVGAVLAGEQQERVSKAIEAARSAARSIAKRVEKNGEDARLVIQELTTAPIDAARFAFLDVDGGARIEPLPSVNAARFAELEAVGEA